MLTLTALRDSEYLISSVALGIDEYYAGIGEAPGVWAGGLAAELGLEGVVDPDQLRALVEGRDPASEADLLEGRPQRRVNVFDATFSAPKSASLLWALGSPEVASMVTRSHTEAVAVALGFLEDKAAVARQQTNSVRRRVATSGFAVAGFAHRTSREGDPQLHTHCLIANLVHRPDGSFVALDGNPLFDWRKAAGSIYQAEVQRLLTERLGVEWGPEKNACREMVGFSRHQLRAFSKRTVAIEAELEARGEAYESPAARMRANDAASLATRPAKDHSLTPTLLAERWQGEAAEVGLDNATAVEAAVVGRRAAPAEQNAEEVMATLVDPDSGLCATKARFTEAKVVERISAASAGRWTTAEILGLAEQFLSSDQVVRLVADDQRRRAPEWSTAAHRALEDAVLHRLEQLASNPVQAVAPELVEVALASEGRLGADQAAAVAALCGTGGSLRAMIAPAGFGKTTAVHAAASACAAAGRPVLGLATTNQAVAGLQSVGLEAMTIARLRLDLDRDGLAPGSVVILDEVSQVATRDAAVVLDAVASAPGAQLWCLGDPRQSTPVGAGGLAAEVSRLGTEGAIVAPALEVNRRQRHAADQAALAKLRAGHAPESQAIRSEAGWEHEEPTPLATREGMADAVVGDIEAHGAAAVVALAVSHGDCEDLADRIRTRLIDSGVISGGTMAGPGWRSADRSYASGDRVLLHTKPGRAGLHNGSVGTVVAVEEHGLRVAFDAGAEVVLPTAFVQGRRKDANPNMSHAWARTIEGAQGGTWEAVHLLGSISLDALVGYTGQSRSRAPTHTWNTKRLVVVDHGGVVADDRSGAEEVLGALAREPVTTFAAVDDPYVLDARLKAERDEHLGVLARAPRDVSHSLNQARRVAEQLGYRHNAAAKELERAEDALAAFGPLAGLRRWSRSDRSQTQAWVDRAGEELRQLSAHRQKVEHEIVALQAGESKRSRFLADNAWRGERVRAIDDTIARHWAAATLAVVRQDDPLAFGIGRLRGARATYAKDLAELNAALPPDRSHQLKMAKQDLAEAEQRLGQARFAANQDCQKLEEASVRRWGRRDKGTVARAAQAVETAKVDLVAALAAERAARHLVGEESSAEHKRATAAAAIEPRRAELSRKLCELDAALDDTLAGRVAALADQALVPTHLIEVIGEPPIDPSGRKTWCGLAYAVESYRDRHPEALGHETQSGIMAAIGPRPGQRWHSEQEWDALAWRVGKGKDLVRTGAEFGHRQSPQLGAESSWLELLDQASAAMETNRVTAERELGRDHGVGLGW